MRKSYLYNFWSGKGQGDALFVMCDHPFQNFNALHFTKHHFCTIYQLCLSIRKSKLLLMVRKRVIAVFPFCFLFVSAERDISSCPFKTKQIMPPLIISPPFSIWLRIEIRKHNEVSNEQLRKFNCLFVYGKNLSNLVVGYYSQNIFIFITEIKKKYTKWF